MVVGVCTIEIHLPFSHSLKDKRKVIKSLTDRLRGRHNISLAEVGDSELWQRSVLGIAAVGHGRGFLEDLFQRILTEVESQIPGDVVNHTLDFI